MPTWLDTETFNQAEETWLSIPKRSSVVPIFLHDTWMDLDIVQLQSPSISYLYHWHSRSRRMICQRKKRPNKDEDFSAIVVPSMKGHGYLDYTVESHPYRAMQIMDELRHHELLCDLVLHVTYKDKIVDFKVRDMEFEWKCKKAWIACLIKMFKCYKKKLFYSA